MSNTVLCQYRVKRGSEAAFEALLKRHWPTLYRLGMVTDSPSRQYRGREQDNGEPVYFELFDWFDGGLERAHGDAQVMAIWEAMEALCEARGGKPAMEFPHVEAIHG
ncbi:MAG: hypothetical protein H6993_03510 [Pseudomonadales bacterium]|nr:hypothetical protein [Pseudomonadales bacterium]MCP5183000.1 hypothetical protein [Pseudomonadales bacterium]